VRVPPRRMRVLRSPLQFSCALPIVGLQPPSFCSPFKLHVVRPGFLPVRSEQKMHCLNFKGKSVTVTVSVRRYADIFVQIHAVRSRRLFRGVVGLPLRRRAEGDRSVTSPFRSSSPLAPHRRRSPNTHWKQPSASVCVLRYVGFVSWCITTKYWFTFFHLLTDSLVLTVSKQVSWCSQRRDRRESGRSDCVFVSTRLAKCLQQTRIRSRNL